MLTLAPLTAYAYDETAGTPYPVPLSPHGTGGDLPACLNCHGYSDPSGDCAGCHGPGGRGVTDKVGKGPHADYTTGAVRCSICHSTHAAPAESAVLLPRATVTATCEMCHDGTGGRSVYGAISAQTHAEPGSQHRVDQTNLVPGGDASTGAPVTAAFAGPGGTLSCGDCHSPHGSNTVAAFPGERRRVPYTASNDAWQPTKSNRLLVKRPGNSTATVEAYGSDWCIACHQGRMSGATGASKNHPVDYGNSASTFTYANVAKLSTETPTAETTMGPLAQDNRGYLMPEGTAPAKRTKEQGSHKPICQQCHEDSRFVGTLSGAEASAAPFSAGLDGNGGNPAFQNFPHETQNAHLLVETGDNLCLNCHVGN
jgi:hypothetical protein